MLARHPTLAIVKNKTPVLPIIDAAVDGVRVIDRVGLEAWFALVFLADLAAIVSFVGHVGAIFVQLEPDLFYWNPLDSVRHRIVRTDPKIKARPVPRRAGSGSASNVLQNCYLAPWSIQDLSRVICSGLSGFGPFLCSDVVFPAGSFADAAMDSTILIRRLLALLPGSTILRFLEPFSTPSRLSMRRPALGFSALWHLAHAASIMGFVSAA